MDKDRHQGLEANTAVKTMLGMKNTCCVNVKVVFEIVHVCVRIRLFQLPFILLLSHLNHQTPYMEVTQLIERIQIKATHIK